MGGRFEERLEGWLEEPPWQEPSWQEPEPLDAREDWDDPEAWGEPLWQDSAAPRRRPEPRRPQPLDGYPPEPEDPWI